MSAVPWFVARLVAKAPVDECNIAMADENEFKQQTESKMNADCGN
ncbi:hypothetical protein [Rhodoblastus sphagnicola]|nr:hypothetical protein [Rhodoblastus sphagnicola]